MTMSLWLSGSAAEWADAVYFGEFMGYLTLLGLSLDLTPNEKHFA